MTLSIEVNRQWLVKDINCLTVGQLSGTLPVMRLSLLVHAGMCISWLLIFHLFATIVRREDTLPPRNTATLHLPHFHTERDPEMSGLLRW